MPDLISHLSSAFLCQNFFSRPWFFNKPYFLLVLFGVSLPDLISRGIKVFSPDLFIPAQFFHTPFACFFQAVFISCFFVQEQRYRAFYAISIGWILHEIFDSLQRHIGPGNYYLLWPVYPEPVSFNLIWAQYWPGIAIVTSLTALLTNKRVLIWIRQQLT
jgi:hypothetical protein